MNATEIVVSEVQRDSGFQMRQLFAESIRERVNLRIAMRIVKFCRSTA